MKSDRISFGRLIWLSVAIGLHFGVTMVLIRFFSVHTFIERCQNHRALATLRNAREFEFALKVTRKLGVWLQLSSICLVSSAVIFWMSNSNSALCFGLSANQSNYNGHAWVEFDGQTYSTDQSFREPAIHRFQKACR